DPPQEPRGGRGPGPRAQRRGRVRRAALGCLLVGLYGRAAVGAGGNGGGRERPDAADSARAGADPRRGLVLQVSPAASSAGSSLRNPPARNSSSARCTSPGPAASLILSLSGRQRPSASRLPNQEIRRRIWYIA